MAGYKDFIGKLVTGECPVATSAELEALLHWLAGRRNDASMRIEAGFKAHGIPAVAARHHTLRYLDSSLFCHANDYYRLFGLSPDSSFYAIRARHKQLLQIFHPDRHPSDGAWFTERTEQLNHAYAWLKTHHGKQQHPRVSSADNPIPTVVRKPRSGRARRAGIWQSLAANKNSIRQELKARIGNPHRFERRLYVILYSIPAILLLVVYLGHLDITDYLKSAEPSSLKGDMRIQAVTERGANPGNSNRDWNTVGDSFSGTALPDEAAAFTLSGDELPEYQIYNDETDYISRSGNGGTRVVHRTNKEKLYTEPGKRGSRAAAIVSKELSIETNFAEDYDHEISILTALSEERSGRSFGYIPVVGQASSGSDQTSTKMLSSRPAGQSIPEMLSAKEPPESSSERPIHKDAEGHIQMYDKETSATQQGDKSWRSPRIKRTTAVWTQLDGSKVGNSDTLRVNVEDRIAVNILLSQYQSAYNISSIARLSRLFDQNAVIKNAKGKPEIEKSYLAMFKKTSQRKLVIKDVKIQRTGDEEFNINADYSVSWKYLNGNREAEKGRLTMRVNRVSEGAKIRKLEHVAE